MPYNQLYIKHTYILFLGQLYEKIMVSLILSESYLLLFVFVLCMCSLASLAEITSFFFNFTFIQCLKLLKQIKLVFSCYSLNSLENSSTQTILQVQFSSKEIQVCCKLQLGRVSRCIYIYTHPFFSPLNRQVLKEHTQLLLLFSNTLNIVIFFIYKGNFYFSKQSFNICTNFLNPKHSAVFALVPRCRSFSPQQWQYCIISTYVMFFMQHLKGMWVSKTYVTYCGFLWGMGNEGERERYLYLIIYLGVGGKIMFIVSEQFYVGWRQIDV
eukprot:TRINITY_DN11524_c0_g1_i11.p4 TRINITY_DN11524_c0_g1~~TRINITY_DN11524_c0_g1_i11.p4  ORF type:complete len:269 (-),score=-16.49 TRINITY_DN11524_c0_g1_i11:225-1031(-)